MPTTATQKANTQDHTESLDDFLANEIPSTECLFTIDSVKDQPTKVKLTPSVSGERCLCEWSLIIDKTHISGVKRHAQKQCCGKQKEIVRVIFKKDALISLTEVFSQLQQNIQQRRDKPLDRRHIITPLPIFTPPGNYSGGGGSGAGDTNDCVYVATKLYQKAVHACKELPIDQRGACLGLALYNFGEAYTLCNVSW
jgi:hypothetical protein